MEYNLDRLDFIHYKTKIINNTFKILGVYEDCVKEENLDGFYTYIYRLSLEYFGLYKNMKEDKFLSLYNILSGLYEDEKLNHKKIKSITFHCISVIKSVEV